MTLEEMHNKIKEYESKWGKLGHTNIMKPEKYTIEHSGLSKGETKMPNMTNDFYAFRRKVAEGKEKNKIAHTATINITDLNKRYFEQITTDGTLIHASTNSDYGKKHYTKIDNYYPDGSARYFQTKSEWDAYQEGLKRTQYEQQKKVEQAKQSTGAKSQDVIDAEARSKWEAEKKAEKQANAINKNAKADEVNSVLNAYKQGGAKAMADAYKKTDTYKKALSIYEKAAKAGIDPTQAKTSQLNAVLSKDEIDWMENDFEKDIRRYKNELGDKSDYKDFGNTLSEDIIDKTSKILAENPSSHRAADYEEGKERSKWEREQKEKERQRKLDIAKEKNRQAAEDISAEEERKSKVAIATEKNRQAAKDISAEEERKSKERQEEQKKIDKLNAGKEKNRQAALAEEEREKNKNVTANTGKSIPDAVDPFITKYKDVDVVRNKVDTETARKDENSKNALRELVGKMGAFANSSSGADERYSVAGARYSNFYDDFEKALVENDNYNKDENTGKISYKSKYDEDIEDKYEDYRAAHAQGNKNEQNRIAHEITELESKRNQDMYSDVIGAIYKSIENIPPANRGYFLEQFTGFIHDGGMDKYINSSDGLDKTVEKLLNKLEDMPRVTQKTGNQYKDKHNKPHGTKFSVEHSAINEEDSVMSEYRAFKQRANEGAKRNRLSHSAVISPADLNAKYYQDIEDHCFLVHASTQYGKGYYQKIEKFYPDGSTRYFYTPQEWEAYQKNKGQDAYRKQQGIKNALSGREAAEKAGQKSTQKLYAKEKKLKEIIEDRDRMSANADKIDKEIQEADKEQNAKVKEKENRKKEIIQDYYKNNPDATSFSDDFNKTVDERGKSNFIVTVQPSGEMVIYAPEFDKAIKEFDGEYKEYLKNFKTVSDKLRKGEYKDDYERRQLESDREFWRLGYFEKLAKVVELENRKQMLAYDEFDDVCRQMGINFDKYNLNEREGKYKS